MTERNKLCDMPLTFSPKSFIILLLINKKITIKQVATHRHMLKTVLFLYEAMLTIKLSRIGKRKKPMYRLIISEKSKDPYGDSLEILGSYNPFTKEIDAKGERINYWISKGAQMTPTVNNLLVDKKVIEGKKVTASKGGAKKKEEAKK
jgi:small subunit ribosomal protein S16